MFREEFKYIRSYFRVVDLNPFLFALNFVTAALYKALDIARPFIAAQIIQELTVQNTEGTIHYIILYAVVYTLYRLSLFLNWRTYSRNVTYCYLKLQDKIFNKVLSVDHSFKRKVNRGRLLNIIGSDLFDIGEMNDEISEFATTHIQIIIVLMIAGYYSLPIAGIIAVSVTLLIYLRTKHDRRYNFFWWKSQKENDNYSNFLNQILTGLQEVKVFNMRSSLHQHLDKIQKRYDKSYLAQRKEVTARDNDIKFVAVFLFRAIILTICIIMMMNGAMEISVLLMLYSYHEQVITYSGDFSDATIAIRLNNAAIRRLSSILNYKSDEKFTFGDLNLDHISGALTFKNVSLTLEKRPILKNLSFKIKPHEFVAIVGYPGSGKTKLFDLILRLNRPTRGKILLDNININEFSKEIYTTNVAVANQIPFIFNTSIRKNLNFVDTNISHQIEACKIAGIHDFIETLPMGYNTILRENGGNISGGQRQMISIARTILTDAEVLLLDDVTTALDPDTAKLVPRLISRIKNNHTVIMITKKPELMRIADRVIVLDDGRISDIGTHEKLLERSALYRSMQAVRSTNYEGGDVWDTIWDYSKNISVSKPGTTNC